ADLPGDYQTARGIPFQNVSPRGAPAIAIQLIPLAAGKAVEGGALVTRLTESELSRPPTADFGGEDGKGAVNAHRHCDGAQNRIRLMGVAHGCVSCSFGWVLALGTGSPSIRMMRSALVVSEGPGSKR